MAHTGDLCTPWWGPLRWARLACVHSEAVARVGSCNFSCWPFHLIQWKVLYHSEHTIEPSFLFALVYGIWDEHEPRSVRDHFPLFAPSITFFSSPLRMYDVSASTHSKMHVLFVQSTQCLNQLTAPAVSRRKPTRICSSASIPWCGCPLMEFLCVGIIWASSSGRNSHTFLQRL